MIEALATLMDAAMDRKKRTLVPLSEEMIYVNAYLYINSERFGKRLTVVKELDESIMQYEVPRLILQPVIENAIEHGVRPSGRGTVVLRGYEKEGYLYLEIVNDGTLTPAEEEKICRLLSPEYDFSREPSGIAETSECPGNVNRCPYKAHASSYSVKEGTGITVDTPAKAWATR